MPKLSVIIPSYNTAPTVERAIASVRSAGSCPLEIIVVDDGSVDQSMQVLRDCIEKWPEVRLFTHEGHVNRGIASTRNLGIAKATGEYLAFLDADDEMLPNRFETCVHLLDQDESLDAIVEPYELVHISGSRSESMKIAANADPIAEPEPAELFRAALIDGLLPHTTSITVRRAALDVVGVFPEHLKFNLEKPLWLKLYARGRVRRGARVPVARYYLHDSSACARNENTAAFRYEDISALLEVYSWMERARVQSWLSDMVRARIRGKYLHYCSYVGELGPRLVSDCIVPCVKLAIALPELLMDSMYWKASIRMMLSSGASAFRNRGRE